MSREHQQSVTFAVGRLDRCPTSAYAFGIPAAPVLARANIPVANPDLRVRGDVSY
ncbi:hypothetical protein ACIHFD_01050 [Nonomuraea sp. NPDC051941]|uniref:hypothetical protein n=1 Tax=Nonomuraea sp. NPDC051941 TaxID=3364373 RepID=UPI0037C9E4AC